MYKGHLYTVDVLKLYLGRKSFICFNMLEESEDHHYAMPPLWSTRTTLLVSQSKYFKSFLWDIFTHVYLCPFVVITGHGMDITDQSLDGSKHRLYKLHILGTTSGTTSWSGHTCVSSWVPRCACTTGLYLHSGSEQDVSALVGGHLGTARLSVVPHLDYHTATVEDVHLESRNSSHEQHTHLKQRAIAHLI